MIHFLLFLGVAILLTVEGWLICRIIAGNNLRRCEEWAFGFPLGALVNALLIFFYTVVGISLTTMTVFAGHLLILLFVGALIMKMKMFSSEDCGMSLDSSSLAVARDSSLEKSNWSLRFFNIFMFIFILLIAIKLIYGVTHAFLPTYYYDSVSQWTMRAKISYFDHAVAFDTNELRGISKSQYPILLHGLQITFMLAQNRWIDLIANAATLLLSLTSFAALALLLLRSAGVYRTILALGFMLTIPLVSIHLAQGYGDIHVAEYMLLSAMLIFIACRSKEINFCLLILSAIFVAAAAWVKQDGIVFGVLPWVVLVIIAAWFRSSRFKAFVAIIPALLLTVPWPLLLIAKNLPLSPHGGGDLSLAFHSDAVTEAFRQLFAMGSFGIHWYVAIAILISVLPVVKKKRSENFPALLILLWGALTFIGGLVIFLCTPNVQFLMNAQTFSRTMLLPLVLLILGSSIIIPFPHSSDRDVLA